MKILRKAIRVVRCTLLISLAAVLFLYFMLWVYTEYRMNRKYSVIVPGIELPADSSSIQHGRHVFLTRGCQDCHGTSLEGKMFLDDAFLAKITAPNLTRGKGGLPDDYATNDWLRVLKHGVDREGKSLLLMPSHESSQLNDHDLACLIAWCRQVPPVDNELERKHEIGPLGRIVLLLDKAVVLPAEKINHEQVVKQQAPATTKIQMGKYLTAGCEGCHRKNMRGGEPLAPGFPPVPDITSNGRPGKWSKAAFIQTLRTGVRPDGSVLKNENMPWQTTKHFSDEEMDALYTYLMSLH